MKKAGELLSFFFDEKTLDKAQGYSELFAFWASAVKAHKIPYAADHSRIVECERHVLLIEADHPGWIQLLQTKQRELLRTFRCRFPDITGISFRLSRKPMQAAHAEGIAYPVEPEPLQSEVMKETYRPEASETGPYDTFEDPELAETLEHLKQGIIARNKLW
ncbi:MAG: DUF721 domain-containing protein [Treponema sp.]|jgi:hypothetical protein|nr:DUF721 domain-containing protein [Treponema sp.]